MAVYEVPLSPQPQRFGITLGGQSLNLTVQYRNTEAGGWVLDIADAQNVPMLRGLPLVTGADLLGQFGYMNFGGELIVQTDHDVDAVPTWGNLGVTSHLYFVTA